MKRNGAPFLRNGCAVLAEYAQEKSVEDKLKELHADYDHVQKKIRFYKDIKKAMENGQPKPDWEDYK